MRKNNRKGFTIVELVIVIAVIAILAGVLIPTFAGVANKAKESAALQEARNLYTEYLAFKNGDVEDTVYLKVTSNDVEYYFVVNDNTISEKPVAAPNDADAVVIDENSVKEPAADEDVDPDAPVEEGEVDG